jgi:hypothetical protein
MATRGAIVQEAKGLLGPAEMRCLRNRADYVQQRLKLIAEGFALNDAEGTLKLTLRGRERFSAYFRFELV